MVKILRYMTFSECSLNGKEIFERTIALQLSADYENFRDANVCVYFVIYQIMQT